MVNSNVVICKVCKSSFLPLTSKEKSSNICYVCQDMASLTTKDCKDVDDSKDREDFIVLPHKKPRYKKPLLKPKKRKRIKR